MRTQTMVMETWTTVDRRRRCCQPRQTSTTDRLMGLGERRDRRENLLSLSLECWWRVRLVRKAQQVSLDPQVPPGPQAATETQEKGVLMVVLVFLVLMVCQDLQGLS